MLNQPGFRQGGPVVIPGLFDGRDKLFFFVNYEETRSARHDHAATPTLLLADAQNGIFKYPAGRRAASTCMRWRPPTARSATPDPTVASAAARHPGNGDEQSGTFSRDHRQPECGALLVPAADESINVTTRPSGWTTTSRATTAPRARGTDRSSRFDRHDQHATATWPGSPVYGVQGSVRNAMTGSVRSTLRVEPGQRGEAGVSGAPVDSSIPTSPATSGIRRRLSPRDQRRRHHQFRPDPDADRARRLQLDVHQHAELAEGRAQPQHRRRVLQVRRVAGHLRSTQRASDHLRYADRRSGAGDVLGGELPRQQRRPADRRRGNLYAVLVGRVTQIAGTARLDPTTGKYVYQGDSRAEGRLQQIDFFVQDNWRFRSNLTINAGVRYAVQPAFYALNSSYSIPTLDDVWGVSGYVPGCDPSDGDAARPATCSSPGVMPGRTPQFQNLAKGVKAYETDWNNIAPSIGINWTPSRGDRLPGQGARQARATRRFRRLQPRLRAARAWGFHRRDRRQSRPDDQRHPQRRQRQPDDPAAASAAATSGRRRSARRGPQQAARLHARGAGVSADEQHRDRRSRHVRSEAAGAVRRHLDGRCAARGRLEVGDLGALHRHAQPRPVDRVRLQRGEHPRERVPERVPQRAGQPAGAHRLGLRRQRPAGVLVRLSRAGHRHGAAADLSRVLHRHADGAGGRPRRATAGRAGTTSRAATSSTRSRRFNPNPFTPAGTNTNTGLAGDPRARPTRSPPGCRRTSSAPIPTRSAAPTSPATAATPSTTRCRSSTSAGCRVACS